MENPSPLPRSSNPYNQALLQNPTNHVNHANQSKAMRNFQEFIFKLAETHPNKPLAPPAKTLLHGRLNRFVADYKAPTHLPYSAMIQRALEELNEKRGSTEESISEYLEKIYDNLPFAHSVLLKHHLEKLSESGEIVVTRDQRYTLPGCLKSSTDTKKNPPRRKGKTDCAKLRRNPRKQKLSKKRNQEECEDEVIKSHHMFDEKKEQGLAGNAACSEDKTDQTERLCCVDREYGSHRDPNLLLSGPSGIETGNENKYSKDVRTEHLDIVPGESVKAGIIDTQYQQERDQSQLSSPEGSPVFDLIGVENLPHSGSSRAWRQTKRLNKKDTATSCKVRAHHEEQQELLKADIVEVPQSANGVKLKRDEKYGTRRKINSEVFESADQPTKLQNELQNQAKSVSPNEQKAQGKQLRRSLRLSSNQPSPEPIEAGQMDEPQHPSNCRRLRVILKSKPNASDVENS